MQANIHGTDEARGVTTMHRNTEQRYNNYTRVWMGRRDGPHIWVDQRGGKVQGRCPQRWSTINRSTIGVDELSAAVLG